MREATKITELRAALRRQGVWGVRAVRLLQDWTDHAREDAAHRREQNAEVADAEQAAWDALGQPEALAKSAARELSQASWLGRHPWFSGLFLPGVIWIAGILAIAFLPMVVVGLAGPSQSESARLISFVGYWQQMFNWFPWLLAMAWLARVAARMPGGWRLFWLTALVFALSPTSIWVRLTIVPHLPGPNVGSLNIGGTGLLGVLISLVGRMFGTYNLGWPASISAAAWVQTALTLLGALAFHWKMVGEENRSLQWWKS